MSLKNASVTLTYKVRGVQTSYGSYEYKERTTSGNILDEDQRLFVIKRPTESNCFQVLSLPESFVNYSISEQGRPNKNNGYSSFKAWSMWMRMSDEQRLEFHIIKLINDMGGYNYTFDVHKA